MIKYLRIDGINELGKWRFRECPISVIPIGLSVIWTVGGGDYAFSISRLDSTRSIKGRISSSLEMAKHSSRRDMPLARWGAAAKNLRRRHYGGISRALSYVAGRDDIELAFITA